MITSEEKIALRIMAKMVRESKDFNAFNKRGK